MGARYVCVSANLIFAARKCATNLVRAYSKGACGLADECDPRRPPIRLSTYSFVKLVEALHTDDWILSPNNNTKPT